MVRYAFAGAIAIAALAVVRLPESRPSPPASPVPQPTAASDAPTTPYRPGEPALVLDETRLTRRPDGHFSATVDVGGQPIEMVVDTGATLVALTLTDAQRLGIMIDPTSFATVGTGASGPVRGQVVTLPDVAVGGRHVRQVQAAVVEGLDRSLLGQSYLRHLASVQISGDTMALR